MSPSASIHGFVRRRGARAVTLVEVLITVAIVAFVMGVAILGLGVTQSARLKRSSTLVASAIRIAYSHANASSKSVRLVFDFDNQQIILEEADALHVVERGDKAGGAAPATEAEQAAREVADDIKDGPKKARAQFTPAKVFGFDPAQGDVGKELSPGVRFYQVETDNLDEPVDAERAYLYFFPGGQTQRAAVVLSVANPDLAEDSDFMTVLVSPLTGKATVRKGRAAMERPRDETEASERSDTAF